MFITSIESSFIHTLLDSRTHCWLAVEIHIVVIIIYELFVGIIPTAYLLTYPVSSHLSVKNPNQPANNILYSYNTCYN